MLGYLLGQQIAAIVLNEVDFLLKHLAFIEQFLDLAHLGCVGQFSHEATVTQVILFSLSRANFPMNIVGYRDLLLDGLTLLFDLLELLLPIFELLTVVLQSQSRRHVDKPLYLDFALQTLVEVLLFLMAIILLVVNNVKQSLLLIELLLSQQLVQEFLRINATGHF